MSSKMIVWAKSIVLIALVCFAFLRIYPSYLQLTQPLPLFNHTSELFNELTVGERFHKCGFWRTWLLPDYSSRKSCEEPPYVYTHTPAGTGIFLGILQKAGLNLPQIRQVSATFALLGIISFAFFLWQFWGSLCASLLACVFLMASQGEFLVWADHSMHAFYWLSYFGALFLFLRRSESRWLSLAHGILLLVTFATDILCGISLMSTELGLAFLDRSRLQKRFLLALGLATAFLLLHLAQNAAYLGWYIAIQDVYYTLMNRIFAYPTRAQLAQFYQEHKLVLWGVEKNNGFAMLEWFGANLQQYSIWAVFFVGLFFLRWWQKNTVKLQLLWQAIVILLGMFSWYFIFLSMGPHYMLPFLVRTAAAFLLAVCLADAFSVIREYGPGAIRLLRRKDSFALSSLRGLKIRPFPAILGIVFLILFEWVALASAPFHFIKSQAIETFAYYREPANTLSEEIDASTTKDDKSLFVGLQMAGSLAAESVIWTNFDSTYLNYHSSAIIVGSCLEDAFLNLDAKFCHYLFLDEKSPSWQAAQSPTHFFLSGVYMPSICGPDCTSLLAKKLAQRFSLLGSGPAWWLFRVK